MIKSIRMKLFLAILIIFVIINVFGMVFNRLYLEKYYISNNKKTLSDSISATIKMIQNNDLDKEQIESEYGIKLTIIDKEELKFLITAVERNESPEFRNGLPPPPRHFEKERFLLRRFDKEAYEEVIKGETVYKEIPTSNNKSRLLLMSKMDNRGKIVTASKSIVALREAVKIANDFFNMASIMSLIIGIIIIFIFSRKITKPILEINTIASYLSKFDFTRKVSIKTGDELEQLGNNINHMSEQLENKIAELNETNEKLKIEIEKERRIERMRKEFISNVSHELKTPLSIIGGYAEGLKDKVNSDSEGRDYYANTIIDETKKMSKLVLELLELSKLESDYKKLNTERIDIMEIINLLAKKYKILIQQKRSKIEIESSTSEILVESDYDLVEQAIGNILSNSVRFVREDGLIKITATQNENFVLVEIENNGAQIPEDKFEDIWNPFYKLDDARTRDSGGTGLGLAIVKSIMDRHKGEYGVKNSKEGVIFWIKFNL